jgi:hypothetical protein
MLKPKLMIGRWLKKAAKWVWENVKDDLIKEILEELQKRNTTKNES